MDKYVMRRQGQTVLETRCGRRSGNDMKFGIRHGAVAKSILAVKSLGKATATSDHQERWARRHHALNVPGAASVTAS